MIPRPKTSKEAIEKLQLEPLQPEGGWFKRTYTGPPGAQGRPIGTTIYFLITADNFSALHRLRTADEVFHFYLGDSVEMVRISGDGRLETTRLGRDITAGENLQAIVPAGNWQGLRMHRNGAWALFGVSCSPGFAWDDFEMARREDLLRDFPAHAEVIKKFTRA